MKLSERRTIESIVVLRQIVGNKAPLTQILNILRQAEADVPPSPKHSSPVPLSIIRAVNISSKTQL